MTCAFWSCMAALMKPCGLTHIMNWRISAWSSCACGWPCAFNVQAAGPLTKFCVRGSPWIGKPAPPPRGGILALHADIVFRRRPCSRSRSSRCRSSDRRAANHRPWKNSDPGTRSSRCRCIGSNSPCWRRSPDRRLAGTLRAFCCCAMATTDPAINADANTTPHAYLIAPSSGEVLGEVENPHPARLQS